MTKHKRITLVSRWTDAAGTRHEGGKTIQVESGLGRDLINRGKARPADAAPGKPTETSKPAGSGEAKK